MQLVYKSLIFLVFFLINSHVYAENPIQFQKSSSGSIAVKHQNLTNGIDSVRIDGDWQVVQFTNGQGILPLSLDNRGRLMRIKYGTDPDKIFHMSARPNHTIREVRIPGWTSIIPPLMAVILALLIKEVVFSLMTGVVAGSFIINGMRFDGIINTFHFLFDSISSFIIGALNDSGHLSVIVFSILIGGMVSLITKNGGMLGILEKVGKYAVSRKKVQLITYTLGIAIFFDDYANTLIVGNTMRSLSDKFKISREKLAYIVDSTAAPISAIAFITTWIGAELGFIGSGLDQLTDYPFGNSPYHVFLQSLKYSFYPIITLIFIYMVIKTGRDFGPMYQAEKRAATTGQVKSTSQQKKDEPNMEDLSPVTGAPHNWHHAFWPVITTIAVTIIGLIITGMSQAQNELAGMGIDAQSYGQIWASMHQLTTGEGFLANCGTLLGMADSYQALLWASFSGLLVAVIITVANRTMNLWDTSHWAVEGFKTMLPAVVILILAWALAATTEQLGTADFIIGLFGTGFHPALIPVFLFIMAFSISFATGSSWSTMAILYPLAIPLSWKLSLQYGWSPMDAQEILLNSVATVLAASVLGDHCSPISDTTILSSLASDCNHLDHVKTQMPYAMTVGVVSLASVGISAWLGGSWILSLMLIAGFSGLLYVWLMMKGKKVDS